MPRKTIAGVIGGGILATVPIVPVDTFCFNHFDKKIYDTPTGELYGGYYEAPLPKATSTPIIEAKVVKIVPTARCADKSRNIYEVEITASKKIQQVKSEMVSRSVGAILIDSI